MNPIKPKTLSELLAESKARREGKTLLVDQTTFGTPTHGKPQGKPKIQLRIGGKKESTQSIKPVFEPETLPETLPILPALPETYTVHGAHGETKEIILNTQQLQAVDFAKRGQSFCLIGAAGTGKTTATLAVVQALIANGIGVYQGDHKHLIPGIPGVIVGAYTRRATNNIKRVMPQDVAKNTLTLHKLLEYKPVYYEVIDETTGKFRKTRRFEPSRTIFNPLDASIEVLIIDESSLVSVELFSLLTAALKSSIVVIFVGDINQLPPCFGSAILGFKLVELPTIELTEVYRQALESIIIKLAHRILSGQVISKLELEQKWQIENELQFIIWPKKIEAETALRFACKLLCNAYDSGKYTPDEDIILCPYNKSFGTIEINKHIANHIAKKEGFLTFEIIAGFQKYYYSIGDKVLFDKEDAVITDIEQNNSYVGKSYQPASYTLDYWGHDEENHEKVMMNTDINIDKLLEMAEQADSEDRVVLASHKITIQIIDTGDFITISSLGELQNLTHAYALTVHKSQGSEWRKVFLLFHHTHYSICREMLYTAITRASKQLVVICEADTFIKGINRQVIKGKTLAEKAEFFKGKIEDRKNQEN